MADPKRTRLVKAARRWALAKRAKDAAYATPHFDTVKAAEASRQHRMAERSLLAAVEALDG